MPASPSTARAINDRLALRLLQHEGPLTAGQLKQLTGLSRPTVADLVERLAAAGLIAVVGEAGEQRRGPNARLYGIVADRAHLAALDVRTDGVAVRRRRPARPRARRGLRADRRRHGHRDGRGTGGRAGRAAPRRRPGADRLHTVGIGAPGLIDPATGELRDSSGLPAWHRRPGRRPPAPVPARPVHRRERDQPGRPRRTARGRRPGPRHLRPALARPRHRRGRRPGRTLRRGASGGTGEIGFLPVPGTGGLPSATDCEGGFHSLAGSAAIAGLAQTHGLTPGPRTEEPVAAALVREAVAAVRGTEGEHAGEPESLTQEGGGDRRG